MSSCGSTQDLVKLESDFSWQVQHFLRFWKMAGVRNVVLFKTKRVTKMERVRSPKRQMRYEDFIFGSVWIIVGYLESSFNLAQPLQRVSSPNLELKDFMAGAVFDKIEGCCCLFRALEMTFSYLMQIIDAIRFAWQVQYFC